MTQLRAWQVQYPLTYVQDDGGALKPQLVVETLRDMTPDDTIVVAGVGLTVNLIGVALLKTGAGESLNVRGAYLEVLGDAAMNIVIRLSSFILVCIGVQIAWNGLSALLRSVLAR